MHNRTVEKQRAIYFKKQVRPELLLAQPRKMPHRQAEDIMQDLNPRLDGFGAEDYTAANKPFSCSHFRRRRRCTGEESAEK